MKIRPYRCSDREAIVTCFNNSVREIGARYYTPDQIEAWAPRLPDWTAWTKRLESGGVFIAEVEDDLAGFVRVEKNGLVDLLYVEPKFERRGVGQNLMQKACSWAARNGASKLWSEVSIAARPLFAAMGFQVEEEQTVERKGVKFKNYRMARTTESGQA